MQYFVLLVLQLGAAQFVGSPVRERSERSCSAVGHGRHGETSIARLLDAMQTAARLLDPPKILTHCNMHLVAEQTRSKYSAHPEQVAVGH